MGGKDVKGETRRQAEQTAHQSPRASEATLGILLFTLSAMVKVFIREQLRPE